MNKPKQLHRLLAMITIILTLANTSFAGYHDTLSEKMSALLAQQHLSGAVWSTVSEENGISTNAIGYKNNRTKILLTPADKILVGSLCKTIIAAGYLRMASIGMLKLDDPVKKYLPLLHLQNPWENNHPVTIEHLLNHTSGLSDVKLWQVFSTTAKPNTPLDHVYIQSPDMLRIHAIPGSMYSYSNIGYNILGKIIEVITKENYEDYLQKELLLPLGMTNSSFHFTNQPDDDLLAWGHLDDGKPVKNAPMYLRAAGQFVTTAEDMGRFLRFIMSDGKINNQQFILTDLLQAIGNQTSTDAAKNGVRLGDALGAYSRDRHGVVGFAKNGNTLGFISMIYFFPEYHKAFFITCNMDSETSNYEVFNEALIHHLGLPIQTAHAREHYIDDETSEWSGFYIPAITKVQPFGLIDKLFSHTRVDMTKIGATLKPFQGKQKYLSFQGNKLFTLDGRTHPSHAFYRDENGNCMITDGYRTLKKTSGTSIAAAAIVVVMGICALLYILATGIIQLIKNRSISFRNPMFFVFIAALCLFAALAFLATQPFMKIGDKTTGTILLAIASLLLPVFSTLSTLLMMIKNNKYYLTISFWASVWVVLLCAMLIANNLMPMYTWK